MLETNHGDSFTAKESNHCYFFGGRHPFPLNNQDPIFWFICKHPSMSLVFGHQAQSYMIAEVTERACRLEVMRLWSHFHRPAHIFALGDNKPIVLPDKASVCTVMGIKQGISHREIGWQQINKIAVKPRGPLVRRIPLSNAGGKN